jgi:hypothetical protein
MLLLVAVRLLVVKGFTPTSVRPGVSALGISARAFLG